MSIEAINTITPNLVLLTFLKLLKYPIAAKKGEINVKKGKYFGLYNSNWFLFDSILLP